MALAAVVTQMLLPRKGGGRVPAAELLMVSYGARQHIRKNALQHLHQEITITRKQGSFTLEESLAKLVRNSLVEATRTRCRGRRIRRSSRTTSGGRRNSPHPVPIPPCFARRSLPRGLPSVDESAGRGNPKDLPRPPEGGEGWVRGPPHWDGVNVCRFWRPIKARWTRSQNPRRSACSWRRTSPGLASFAQSLLGSSFESRGRRPGSADPSPSEPRAPAASAFRRDPSPTALLSAFVFPDCVERRGGRAIATLLAPLAPRESPPPADSVESWFRGLPRRQRAIAHLHLRRESRRRRDRGHSWGSPPPQSACSSDASVRNSPPRNPVPVKSERCPHAS